MNTKLIQGVEVPELGLGTYKLIGNQGEQTIKNALRLGYRHIDTAQEYRNEAEVGRAIKASHISRDQLFVTTKVERSLLEPEKLMLSVEASLLKLQMEYVDLLLIHWPNPQIPLNESLEAMQILKEQGKAVHIGVSNFPMKLLRQAMEDFSAPIFCNQVEYHALLGQFDLLDYASEHDLLVTAYSPLAQGRLISHPTLNEIAKKYDKTASQVALKWLVEQEQVVAIPKATSEQHLLENLDALSFDLEDDDFYAIDDLDKTTRIVTPDFAPDWD
jgi:2,5-diketo-D-gluconate reductase B